MTAQRLTARERFWQDLATNPRCMEAPKTGRGFVILGYVEAKKAARPVRAAAAIYPEVDNKRK
jgi:hypothetical protein